MAEDYRKWIIEMIDKINNQEFLEYIFFFVRGMYRKCENQKGGACK